MPSALQRLIDAVDRDLTFAIEVEAEKSKADVVNYDEVRDAIVAQLAALRDAPSREEPPLVYHLDVGAMYPNIILTNRLQPGAIVDQATCAACDFNRAGASCKRPMEWVWRGDFLPAGAAEYEQMRTQLRYETVDGQPFHALPAAEQAKATKARLKGYCQKVYKKTKVTEEVARVDTVCMRENPFYVNTVRNFRDRRYDYKRLTKTWKKATAAAEAAGDAVARKDASDRATVFDSLQLAHKCILNSFYGYVMRKARAGARCRWRAS